MTNLSRQETRRGVISTTSMLESYSSVLISKHTSPTLSFSFGCLERAKRLSKLRPYQKIIFATSDSNEAGIASIWWGVQPVIDDGNLFSKLKHQNLIKKGERIINANDAKHIEVKTVD